MKADYIPALTVMAELLRFTGRYDKAIAYYKKAEKLDATQQITLKGMAKAHYYLDQHEEAIKCFEATNRMQNELEKSEHALMDESHFKTELALAMIESGQRKRAF